MTTTTKPLPPVKVTFGKNSGNFVCCLERVVDRVTDVGALVRLLQSLPWVDCAVRKNDSVVVSYAPQYGKPLVRKRLNAALESFQAQVKLA